MVLDRFPYFLDADERHQPHGLGKGIHLQHVFDVAASDMGMPAFSPGSSSSSPFHSFTASRTAS
jgi:hypothetical protein